LKFRCFTKYSR